MRLVGTSTAHLACMTEFFMAAMGRFMPVKEFFIPATEFHMAVMEFHRHEMELLRHVTEFLMPVTEHHRHVMEFFMPVMEHHMAVMEHLTASLARDVVAIPLPQPELFAQLPCHPFTATPRHASSPA